MKRYIRASNDREEQETYYALGEEIEKSLIDAGIAAHLESVWKKELLSGRYSWIISFHADTKEDRCNALIHISHTPKYHDKFGIYTFGYCDFDCESYALRPDNITSYRGLDIIWDGHEKYSVGYGKNAPVFNTLEAAKSYIDDF